jgi:3-oxoadipate enol-lactonase
MPYAKNNGVRIYWEEHGAGEPLLLLMGLGGSLGGWWRILPYLAEKYRVIVFDNRGVGQSEAPPAPYSIPEMMRDAKAVMDAARVESANVLGLSMGGMMAQELVLNFPEKVRKLILAGTCCGSINAVWAKPDVQMTLMASGVSSPEEAFLVMAPFIYDQSTPLSKIKEDLAMRKGRFPSRESYLAQLRAIIAWQGTHARLGQIKCPTMILHGVNDQLIPFENAVIMANQISNSKLVQMKKMSHIFMTDETERSVAEILKFLEN